MSLEVLPGEAMGSSDERVVVVLLQTPSGFHTKDRHAATNPWAYRDAAAKENGYVIHSAMETCNASNAGSGGFGAVHMAQKVPLSSGEEDSDMSGASFISCEDAEMSHPAIGSHQVTSIALAPLTQAEEKPDAPGLVAARLVGGSRVLGIRGPSSTFMGRPGPSPARAFVPRRRRDLRAGMQPASLAACEPDAGPGRAQITGCRLWFCRLESGCTISGSLSTTAPNSRGRAGSPDIGMNPAVTSVTSARVGREVARRKRARGIVDPSVPLAKGCEAPLGPDSTEPLLAIKSGIADKSLVLDERKHWLRVSEAKHPNINNLIDDFTSTIPAHAAEVDGAIKEFGEKTAAHFVTSWAPHDLHDYIRKGHSDPSGVHHDGQITLEQMTKIAYDVAVALHHMHKNCGVAHRDLKPGNILMTDAEVAQVTDFGIAAEPNITRENMQCCHPNQLGKHHFPNHVGTSHFSSPQQTSYRLREIELIPGEIPGEQGIPYPGRTRERRIEGQTINPATGQKYMVCIALQSRADVVREQKKWYDYGFESYVPPGRDFVYEGQLDGGCQASAKMDVWAAGTFMLEGITGKAIYDLPRAEANIMRHWIKLAARPHDDEERTVYSDDGTKVTKTEYQLRKEISTIKGALGYTEKSRFDALELAYRLAAVGLKTNEELAAEGIDPDNLGGDPEDLLDANGQLPIRGEALGWGNAVHARLAHENPNACLDTLKAMHAEEVAGYQKVEIDGPNAGLNLVSRAPKAFPVRLVKVVRPVRTCEGGPSCTNVPENFGHGLVEMILRWLC